MASSAGHFEIAEVLQVISMLPGLFLVYYSLKKNKFKLKPPLYAYYLLCVGSIIYHSYKSCTKTHEFTPYLLKLDIFCQQVLIYACILCSPYAVRGSLMILPLSILSVYLCDMKVLQEQNISLASHACCLLSASYCLDYRITILWIIAMTVFTQKELFPKCVALLWHSLNHICTYYTWHALERMNASGFL